MDNEERLKLLDNLGSIAEGLGKEMRGWTYLRKKYDVKTLCHTPESGLSSDALFAAVSCVKLLHLYCHQVLAAWRWDGKKVERLYDAIEAEEREKFALQCSCRNTILYTCGIYKPAFAPTVDELKAEVWDKLKALEQPEEQTTTEQTEQPEQNTEQQENAISTLIPALLLMMAIAKRRKEQA